MKLLKYESAGFFGGDAFVNPLFVAAIGRDPETRHVAIIQMAGGGDVPVRAEPADIAADVQRALDELH